MLLDESLNLINSLLELVFLKLKKGFLLHSVEMLFLDFFNFLLVIFMEVFHALYVLSDGHFLSIDTVLMLSMEVSFLSKLFPGAFGLVCDHVSLGQLYFHGVDFGN